jgi:hypothetical protein
MCSTALSQSCYSHAASAQHRRGVLLRLVLLLLPLLLLLRVLLLVLLRLRLQLRVSLRVHTPRLAPHAPT